MQTKSGCTIETLLDVTVVHGTLFVTLPTSEVILDVSESDVSAAIQHIKMRVQLDKKPCATYIKVLEQIDAERTYLAELYTKLFSTYQRAVDTTPKTRLSPKDKAIADMLSQMPDKMLRDFAAIRLGDAASDFVLPGERDELIAAYIANGKVAVVDAE